LSPEAIRTSSNTPGNGRGMPRHSPDAQIEKGEEDKQPEDSFK